MKPSISKSINLSNHLPFDYSINFRKFNTSASKKYWEQYLTEHTERCEFIDYSIYNIEKDMDNGRSYHSHYLTKMKETYSFNQFTELATTLFGDLIKEHRTIEGVNKKLLKIKSSSSSSKQITYKDTYFDIPYKKCFSKTGMIYIEPIVDDNIIFYNNKCSDWGITEGFIQGKSGNCI